MARSLVSIWRALTFPHGLLETSVRVCDIVLTAQLVYRVVVTEWFASETGRAL